MSWLFILGLIIHRITDDRTLTCGRRSTLTVRILRFLDPNPLRLAARPAPPAQHHPPASIISQPLASDFAPSTASSTAATAINNSLTGDFTHRIGSSPAPTLTRRAGTPRWTRTLTLDSHCRTLDSLRTRSEPLAPDLPAESPADIRGCAD